MNWLNLFWFLVLVVGLLVILIGCMIFMYPFPDILRMSLATVSFLAEAILWNYLPAKCFPLTSNFGQNICRLFHVLAQFPLTVSEKELMYYHEKLNVRITSRVVEWLDLGNEKISSKTLKCVELLVSTQPATNQNLCILHDLFLVKLETYGFQTDALSLVYEQRHN